MYSPLYFIKLHNTRTHARMHGMRFIISRPVGRREIITENVLSKITKMLLNVAFE